MNLRRDKIDETKPPEYKFRVNDKVQVNTSSGGIKGKVILVSTYQEKTTYTIELDNIYHLGIPSTDKSVNLLKPVNLIIRSITVYENEITLDLTQVYIERKYPHILLNPNIINSTISIGS